MSSDLVDLSNIPKALLYIYEAIANKFSGCDLTNATPEQIALIATTGIKDSLGGQVLYIPMNMMGMRRERDIKICQAWEAKQSTIAELAIKFDLNQQQIYAIISTSSLVYVNKMATLETDRTKRNALIHSARESGASIKQIARDFGLTKAGIVYILRQPVNNPKR